MCNLTNTRIHRKSFTGYKIVLYVKGRYFSPVTGIEYKEGMTLPKLDLTSDKQIYRNSYWVTPAYITYAYYSDKLRGRTAVFKNYEEALTTSREKYESIAKMTISGHLLKGTCSGISDNMYCVVAGRKIEKIELIRESTEVPELLIDID